MMRAVTATDPGKQQRAVLRVFWQATEARAKSLLGAVEVRSAALSGSSADATGRREVADSLRDAAREWDSRTREESISLSLPPAIGNAGTLDNVRLQDAEEQLRALAARATYHYEQLRIASERLKTVQRRRSQSRAFVWAASIAGMLLIVVLVFALAAWVVREPPYGEGVAALEGKQWEIARSKFRQVGDYKDSERLLLESYYQPGLIAIQEGEWNSAIIEFEALGRIDGTYRDVHTLLDASYRGRGDCGGNVPPLVASGDIEITDRAYVAAVSSACGSETTVVLAFYAFREKDGAAIQSLMSAEGLRNAETWCGGLAIDCLDSNYAGAGQLERFSTMVANSSSGHTSVELRSTWTEDGEVCQNYDLVLETGAWLISYFDSPNSC